MAKTPSTPTHKEIDAKLQFSYWPRIIICCQKIKKRARVFSLNDDMLKGFGVAWGGIMRNSFDLQSEKKSSTHKKRFKISKLSK